MKKTILPVLLIVVPFMATLPLLGQMMAAIVGDVHASAASNTFKNVQSKSVLCSGGTTCAVTVTSTGTGNLLGLGYADTNSMQISSVSGGGTWVHPSGCLATNGSAGTEDVAYVLSSTSGTTTVTVTATGTQGFSIIEFFETSYTSAVTYDGCANRNQSSGAATIAGVTLSPTGSSDVLFQFLNPTGSCSSIDSSYVATFNSGAGGAYLLNSASGTAPNWGSCGSSQAALSGMAFK